MLKRLRDKIKKSWCESRIPGTARRFMDKTSPSSTEEMPGLKIYIWAVSENYTIQLNRMIRGDLIDVLNGRGILVAGWVDQSFSYGGLLGINDVWFNPDLDLYELLSLLRKN